MPFLRSREWPWTAISVAAFLVLSWRARSFVTDDAWISVRYAENLASGLGFVWNPGGPRVEGFSNPALVGFEALAHSAGLPALGAARVLGIASGVALLALIGIRGPATVGRTASRVALLLTALCAPLALWALGGLETLPTALVITAGALRLSRSDGGGALRAGMVLAPLPWLRPEGVVIAVGLAAAAEGPGLLRGGERRAAAARLARAAGPALASQVVLELLRLLVYGHPLPNSVLYKEGTSQTFNVLGGFLLEAAPVVLAAGLGVLAARGRARVLAVAPLIYALGSLGTLDSANAFSRFLLPAWPCLALLSGLAVARVRRAPGRFAAPAAVAAATLLAALVLFDPPGGASDVQAFARKYADCRQTARLAAAGWLRAATPAGTSFSVTDAGLVAARAGGRPAVDEFLLNDPLIQRTGPESSQRRAQLVLGRRPSVLAIVSRSPARPVPRYDVDRALLRDPRFARYRLVHVARGSGPGCQYHVLLYRRAA